MEAGNDMKVANAADARTTRAAHPLATVAFDRLTATRTKLPYALVDYPNYLNPGDAAIWHGTTHLLARLNGNPPAYSSTLEAFSSARCRRAIGDGPIYFLGGGNFGNLYWRHHQARLRVMRAMKDNPQIHLPLSTAWTTDDTALHQETAAVLSTLSQARFFAREARTHRDLAARFGIEAALCPDLAHAMELPAMAAPTTERVYLLRRDSESTGQGEAFADRARDWPDLPRLKLVNRLGKKILKLPFVSRSGGAMGWIASLKVKAAADHVALGRTLLTDRLHAMIIAHLIGREVAIIDNATGKVASYFDTWRDNLSGVSLGHGSTATAREQ